MSSHLEDRVEVGHSKGGTKPCGYPDFSSASFLEERVLYDAYASGLDHVERLAGDGQRPPTDAEGRTIVVHEIAHAKLLCRKRGGAPQLYTWTRGVCSKDCCRTTLPGV